MAFMHFSFDIDWAPEHVLEDFRNLLKQLPCASTVFFTHESDECAAISALKNVETGLHPNFKGSKCYENTLGELQKKFPNARGVRNHDLFYSSSLLKIFYEKNIAYFSNDLMFLHEDLRPCYDWSGLVRLPYYWEDDVHSVYFSGEFKPAALANTAHEQGMRIFNFHPIHLYLNTRDFSDYLRVKEAVKDPSKAKSFQRAGVGTRTFFEALVSRALPTSRCLGDVAAEFASRHAFEGKTREFFAAQRIGEHA